MTMASTQVAVSRIRKPTPFCKDCGQRKVAGTPRNRETKTCRQCYDANHDYHLCPIAGCPTCDGEE